MYIQAPRETDTALATLLPPVATRVGELPTWSPWAILAGTAVVVGGGALALGASVGLAVVAVAVVYAAAVYLASRVVEGPRRPRTASSPSWSPRRS